MLVALINLLTPISPLRIIRFTFAEWTHICSKSTPYEPNAEVAIGIQFEDHKQVASVCNECIDIIYVGRRCGKFSQKRNYE